MVTPALGVGDGLKAVEGVVGVAGGVDLGADGGGQAGTISLEVVAVAELVAGGIDLLDQTVADIIGVAGGAAGVGDEAPHQIEGHRRCPA